ncbi:hypothetical protein [Microvirus mar64]|uniref:Uncharacterized protein n=1 Tax=Microvirus mar64 TaxID=2851201 RepID=A0A8F5MLA3_9VIRU|nr:hypothetical protein [Microvirus mar64]
MESTENNKFNVIETGILVTLPDPQTGRPYPLAFSSFSDFSAYRESHPEMFNSFAVQNLSIIHLDPCTL